LAAPRRASASRSTSPSWLSSPRPTPSRPPRGVGSSRPFARLTRHRPRPRPRPAECPTRAGLRASPIARPRHDRSGIRRRAASPRSATDRGLSRCQRLHHRYRPTRRRSQHRQWPHHRPQLHHRPRLRHRHRPTQRPHRHRAHSRPQGSHRHRRVPRPAPHTPRRPDTLDLPGMHRHQAHRGVRMLRTRAPRPGRQHRGQHRRRRRASLSPRSNRTEPDSASP
jgi:hypothetical protein